MLYVTCCLIQIPYWHNIDHLLHGICLFDLRSIFQSIIHPVTFPTTFPTTSSQSHSNNNNNKKKNNNNNNKKKKKNNNSSSNNSNAEFVRHPRRCQVRARPHGLCLVPMICRRCWGASNLGMECCERWNQSNSTNVLCLLVPHFLTFTSELEDLMLGLHDA